MKALSRRDLLKSSLLAPVAVAGGGIFGGNDAGASIEEGKVEGSSVSFKVGSSSYSGTIKDNRIELQRTTAPRMQMPHPAEPEGPRPVIGPPPDGSDPSRNPNFRLPPPFRWFFIAFNGSGRPTHLDGDRFFPLHRSPKMQDSIRAASKRSCDVASTLAHYFLMPCQNRPLPTAGVGTTIP